jgi:hypothetical protein
MTQAQNKGVTGGFKAKPTIVERRKDMKYKVNTTSTTASGVVPIQGATKYPSEPDIYFTRETWVKQCHLVDKCSKEVGWFALVDYDETNNSFTITEIVIPNQEVTAAETDIGKEDLADAAMELIEQGKDTSKMYAWFHSHVDMGVSPSGQDEYQVEDFLEDLADQPEVPAFIRGIQNKKGDLKIDVYYIQHGIAYQNVNFYVIHDDDPQWYKDIEAEIKTKVTERTYYCNGAYGGGRTSTGKSGYGNANGNKSGVESNYGWGYDDGFRRGHGYWDWDDYWDDDDEDDETDGVVSEVTDLPPIPKPIEVHHSAYLNMETVWQSTKENIEVMLDLEGRLWVCDERGEMYDYQEYTQVYGEIGSPPKYPVVK